MRDIYLVSQMTRICFSCVFDLYPQVLAHRPQNPWNFISVESDKVIFYVNEVTVEPTMKGLEILILLPTSREGRRAGNWKDWCWSWNSNTVATWCKELTHWKRPWCWERLKAGGEGHNRGWDGWMASPTQWTWVWASSSSWWWTGRPSVLQSMGSQIVGHNWEAEWTDW